MHPTPKFVLFLWTLFYSSTLAEKSVKVLKFNDDGLCKFGVNQPINPTNNGNFIYSIQSLGSLKQLFSTNIHDLSNNKIFKNPWPRACKQQYVIAHNTMKLHVMTKLHEFAPNNKIALNGTKLQEFSCNCIICMQLHIITNLYNVLPSCMKLQMIAQYSTKYCMKL